MGAAHSPIERRPVNATPDIPTAEQLAMVRRQLQMPQTATDAEVIGTLVNLVAL